MRRAARVDENQAEIVEGLRAVGATVLHLHHVGKGCPDILVGYRGLNFLIEIKNPCQSWTLTDDEREFIRDWRGNVTVAEELDVALRAIGAI